MLTARNAVLWRDGISCSYVSHSSGMRLEVYLGRMRAAPWHRAFLIVGGHFSRPRCRDDLVFRFRTRAVKVPPSTNPISAWAARCEPSLRETALDVIVQGRCGRYAMTVNSSVADGLGFTVGSGWALLMYPETLPAWLKALLSLAWVVAVWVRAGVLGSDAT